MPNFDQAIRAFTIAAQNRAQTITQRATEALIEATPTPPDNAQAALTALRTGAQADLTWTDPEVITQEFGDQDHEPDFAIRNAALNWETFVATAVATAVTTTVQEGETGSS